MQATARGSSVVESTSAARRRLIRIVRPSTNAPLRHFQFRSSDGHHRCSPVVALWTSSRGAPRWAWHLSPPEPRPRRNREREEIRRDSESRHCANRDWLCSSTLGDSCRAKCRRAPEGISRFIVSVSDITFIPNLHCMMIASSCAVMSDLGSNIATLCFIL